MTDAKRDIAELLKTQRENLGLSIDEIFERTRIDPGVLQAFEEGNFDVLPRAYARLFLKTYARELNLDAQDILTRFEKIIVTPPARPKVQAPPKHHLNIRLSSLLLIACALILVAIIVLNIKNKIEPIAPLDTTTSQPPVAQPPSEIQPAPQDSAQSAIPLQTGDSTPTQSDTVQIIPPSEPEADAASPSENQETPSPAQSDTLQRTLPPESEDNAAASPSENREMPSPVRDARQPIVSETPTSDRPPAPEVLTTYNLPLPVVIADDDLLILSCVATENTSLSIAADGRDLFAGILPIGNTQRWQAGDHFQIYVQRAGAISLSLQDAPLESASPPDRSLRLHISRTYIRVEELEE